MKFAAQYVVPCQVSPLRRQFQPGVTPHLKPHRQIRGVAKQAGRQTRYDSDYGAHPGAAGEGKNMVGLFTEDIEGQVFAIAEYFGLALAHSQALP